MKKQNASLRVEGEVSESFAVGVNAKQGCVMLPWMFNIFMDGCKREMKAQVGYVGGNLRLSGVG